MSDFDPVEINIDFKQNVDTEGKKATDSIDAMATASDKAQESLAQNIAIQKKVISDLRAELSKLKESFDKVNIGTQDPKIISEREKLIGVVRNLTGELKGEEAALLELEKASGGHTVKMKTLETQIREVREEMAQLKIAGREESQEYTELEKKLGTLGTAYREVFNVQKALSTGGAQMAGMLSGLSALSGLLSAGAGAFGLVNSESENFAKIQTKVQSLMAITIGLQQISNTLHVTSTFRITTVAKAKELWAAATNRLTVALGISNVAAKALMATLTLGLSVAIGAIIYLLDSYVTKQRKAAEETKKFNQGVADSSAEVLVSYNRLKKGYSALGDDLKAKEKYILDNQDAFRKLGASINDVSDADNLFINNTEAFKTAVMERAKAAAAMDIAAEKYKEVIVKQMKAGAMPDKVTAYQSQGQFGGVITYETDNSSKKKLEAEIIKEETEIEKLVGISVESQNKAAAALKQAGIDSAETIIEGSKAWWEAQQKNAKARLDAFKDTEQGSEEWNKAVDDYNKATEKVKQWDIKGQNKEEETAADKAKRLANERLKAKEELAKKEADIQIQNNKAVLALMADGEDKKKALAKQAYKEQLNQLDDQEKSYLDQLNKSKNLKPSDKGYISSLPDYVAANPSDAGAASYYQSLTDQRLLADQTYVSESEKIERDSAETRKKIWAQVLEAFMSDVDQQKQTINSFYDEQIKKLTEAGATQAEIDQLNVYRVQELAQVQGDAALKLSTFYRDAFGDIDRYGTSALRNLKQQIDEVIASAKQIDQGGKTFIQVELPTDQFDQDGNRIKETVTLTIEEFNRLQDKAVDVSTALKSKNPFAAVGSSWKDLKTAMKSGDKDAMSNATKDLIGNAQAAVGQVKELGSGLREAFGDDVGDAVDLMTGVADGALSIAEGISSGNPVAVLKGVLQVYNTLTAGAKEYRAAQKAWLNELIELQVKYNAVLNEQIRLQGEANVFITDYATAAVNASKALADAQKNFSGQLFKYTFDFGAGLAGFLNPKKIDQELDEYLRDLQVKIGVKKKKFLGITTGSKDVFGSLLGEYPELIDSAGKFNAQLAETLLELDGIPEKTKQGLTALIEYQNEIDAAQEAIADAVKNLAGSLGNELADSLRSAWKEGEDGFEAFKKTVSSGLEDILSELAFNSVFSGSFSKLQEDLAAALTSGGSADDITAAYADFFSKAPDLVAKYNEAMDAALQAADAAGFDFSDTDRSASSKGIAQASQDSVDELNGRMTAIQTFIYDIKNMNAQSLDFDREQAAYDNMIMSKLDRIGDNTEYCKYLLNIKQGIDDINLKGVKIKS